MRNIIFIYENTLHFERRISIVPLGVYKSLCGQILSPVYFDFALELSIPLSKTHINYGISKFINRYKIICMRCFKHPFLFKYAIWKI